VSREQFIQKRFARSSLAVIAQANAIIGEYAAQGFKLTLRQLYYQFVARDLIPNTERSYKRLGNIISEARLAGHVDWDAIEDRTRELTANPHWQDPEAIIAAAASSYRIDKWQDQDFRVEVWIEKEALVGVVERICRSLDVDFFACRGYVSQSEQWAAGKRFAEYAAGGQEVVVLHLGDHDPSGIDMTRDNDVRLALFAREDVTVRRLALNYDQVETYGPPPNPAKVSDSRYEGYLLNYGAESWELDALNPNVLQDLIREAVLEYRDEDAWQRLREREAEERRRLREVEDRWGEVVEFLGDHGGNGSG